MQQEGLERFGGDLQDARGLLQQAVLMGGRHVPVPVPDGNARLVAQVVQAVELVVDEGLERADVECADAGRGILPELREDGEEGRLGLARGRLCGQKDVLIRIEDGVRRGYLDGAQALPIMAVDEVLDERGVAVERSQGPSFPELVSARTRRPGAEAMPSAARG